MIKVRFLALLAVLALVLTLPAIASAGSPEPPHIFIGSATVNGLSAPSGTVITAMIGGDAKGSVNVGSNGAYGPLHVNSGSGSEITFVLDSLTASETATWEQGGASVLALNASVDGGGGSGAAHEGAAGESGESLPVVGSEERGAPEPGEEGAGDEAHGDGGGSHVHGVDPPPREAGAGVG